VSEKKGKYAKFWKEFGKAIKLGIIEDTSNRVRLAKLLRFHRYHIYFGSAFVKCSVVLHSNMYLPKECALQKDAATVLSGVGQ